MIITTDFLAETFAELNARLFAGRLPVVKFDLCKTKGTLARCRYSHVRRPDGAIVNSDFSILASVLYDLEPEEWRNIIAHEMIHLFIAVHNFLDEGPHGPLFRAVMNELNSTHGMKISAKAFVPPTKIVERKPKVRVVARLSMADGSVAIKVLPRVASTIRAYCNAVKRARGVKNVELFVSDNPFFGRYPSSGALRYHPVDAAVLGAALEGAAPLSAL